MEDNPNAIWRFAESPFTWGGLGVIIGAMLASPHLFKFAFWGGGMAIALGLLRARALNDKSVPVQVIVNIVLVACLAGVWLRLWKVIPPPVEPLTRQDALEILGQKSNPALSASSEPITKTEFQYMLQQYRQGAPPQGRNATKNSNSDIFADFSGERIVAESKSSASEALNWHQRWIQRLHTMDSETTDGITFAKPRTAQSCPTTTSPGCDTSMDQKDVPAYREKREQEKAKTSNDVRAKTRAVMTRVCALRSEIINKRMETWEARDLSDTRTDDLCAKIATIDYSPEDMNRIAQSLDQLQKRLAITLNH